MRLTSILVLSTCMHLSARTCAQPISLAEKHSPLETIFNKITDQTGVLFVYRDEWLKKAKEVDIAVQNASLQQVLDICFKEQPFTYAIFDKMVVLKARPAPSPVNDQDHQAPSLRDIHGHIMDSLGSPLTGASVTIKGTKKGTQTNIKGEFELKEIAPGTTLLISYTGYADKEVVVPDNAVPLLIILKTSQSALDAMVVQAYGTTSRRFNVGSNVTVTAKDIERQPVTNVLLALQGLASGLNVTSTSGAPGATVQVQIRGQNSLRTDASGSFGPYDQPLFIIDGVPFAPQNQSLNRQVSVAGGGEVYFPGLNFYGGISPFNSINPADIESINILKDADATSIYGSQGANGVILITTKKGKPGKSDLNLSVNTGINAVARPVKTLNTQQYLQLRKDAFAADGVTPNLTPYDPGYAPDLLVFDQDKYTNWYHQFFGKTAKTTNVHASLSGGSANTTFIVSAGYTNAGYNLPGDFADNRLTLHSNVHHNSLNGRLSVDFGADYSYEANNSSGAPNVTQAFTNPPNLPDLIDAKGKLVWNYQGIDLTQYQSYGYLKQTTNLHNYNSNNFLRLSYQVVSGLNITVHAGFSRVTTKEAGQVPLSAQPPSPYAQSRAAFTNSEAQSINIEPQINYSHAMGGGVLNALIGGTYKKNISSNDNLSGNDYSNDDLLGSINGASTISASSYNSFYKYAAAFGRINYVYDRKYIINLTGRRDGSSNFGPGHQFGNFGSAGLGWIFSEESAFKAMLPVVSYAKISGNYGTNGSDGITPYNYQAYYSSGYTTFQGIRPYIPANLYNPDYSWDVKKSWNAALDLGFFHDRLLLNATWYRSRTGNQLTNNILPSQTGFPSVVGNLNATIQNAGWEFTVTSNNINSKDFKWTTNFNISLNRNKLIAFPGLANSPYANFYAIGKPTNEVFGFRYKDVNPATGVFEFYNAKGAATYSPDYRLVSQGGDQQPIVDPTPRYFGGLTNTLTYKKLSLTVFFQFTKQKGGNYLAGVYNTVPGGTRNVLVQALDHWKKPGDISSLEKLTAGYTDAYAGAGYFTHSEGVYSDASYLRLKNLSLSYTLSAGWLKKLHMQDGRFFCNAQNLLTITGYKAGDPETPGSFYVLPLQRTVSLGLSLDF